MTAENKTPARNARKLKIANTDEVANTTTIAPDDNKESTVTTLIETPAPIENAPAADAAPVDAAPAADGTAAMLPDVSNNLPESKAAGVLADETGNDKPLVVPATPTAAQLAARNVFVKFTADLWVPFVNAIPGAAGAFVEPNDDQIDEMIEQYMQANPGTRMTKAAFAVKDQIDADRAAHETAAANSKSVRVEYMRAMRAETANLLANIDQLILADGGKPVQTIGKKSSTSTSSTGATRTRIPSGDHVKQAAAMHKYAAHLGLQGVFLVDITKDGYKGVDHPVCLHADGSWTKATYDRATGVATDTGVAISTWKYFDKNGDDRTDATPAELVPQHSLAKGEMFGILMRKADGSLVDIDGVTDDRRNAEGVRIVGSVKHYALWTPFLHAAEDFVAGK